jgi:hypothetical protein
MKKDDVISMIIDRPQTVADIFMSMQSALEYVVNNVGCQPTCKSKSDLSNCMRNCEAVVKCELALKVTR